MGKYMDEYMKRNSYFYSPIECPICGKKFIPAPEHYWKIGSYGGRLDERTERVCSYSCMRKWEKEQQAILDAKKKKKKENQY